MAKKDDSALAVAARALLEAVSRGDASLRELEAAKAALREALGD